MHEKAEPKVNCILMQVLIVTFTKTHVKLSKYFAFYEVVCQQRMAYKFFS